MKCPHCDQEIPEKALFCGYCGQEINQAKKQTPKKRDIPTRKNGLPTWLKWVIGIASVFLVVLLVIVGLELISRNRTKDLIENVQNRPAPTSQDEIVFEPTETMVVEQPIATLTAAETAELTPQPTEETPTLQVVETEELNEPQKGDEKTNNIDDAEMVFIPEGEFSMGAMDDDRQALANEKPKRTIYLDSFWIYKYEVTNAQYRSCIASGSCQGNSDQYPEDNYPVVSVNWHEADAYCVWAGGRLPSEAEWEKAARGEGMNYYPWGNTTPNCTLVNYSGCVGGPAPVGSFPNGASPYGVLDMAGNVWEWVVDWFDPDYYSQLGNTNNPLISGYTGLKGLRGGSWGLGGNELRISFRGSFYPDDTYHNIGFRCITLP